MAGNFACGGERRECHESGDSHQYAVCGQVIAGWHDFKLFRSIPLDQLKLPVYDDFRAPERLFGES